jgi:hypothetical protein
MPHRQRSFQEGQPSPTRMLALGTSIASLENEYRVWGEHNNSRTALLPFAGRLHLVPRANGRKVILAGLVCMEKIR